jgi:hypothetical protein
MRRPPLHPRRGRRSEALAQASGGATQTSPPELAPGQYWNQILILDSNEFWRIRDRLKRERGWE